MNWWKRQWLLLRGYVLCCVCHETIEEGQQAITTFAPGFKGDYAHKTCRDAEMRRLSYE